MSSSTLDGPRMSQKLHASLKTRPLPARLPSSIAALTACVLVLFACAEFEARAACAQQQSPPPPMRPLEREIAGSEVHSYGMTLARGQFVRAVFEQRGVDVVVTLVDPQGDRKSTRLISIHQWISRMASHAWI